MDEEKEWDEVTEEAEREVEDDPYEEMVVRPQRGAFAETLRNLNRGIQYREFNINDLK